MKLDSSNLFLIAKDIPVANKFCLVIYMPDNSMNYIHTSTMTLDQAIRFRDKLMGLIITEQSISINEDEKYYRLEVIIPIGTDATLVFHSRKLNLNDALYERFQIIDEVGK